MLSLFGHASQRRRCPGRCVMPTCGRYTPEVIALLGSRRVVQATVAEQELKVSQQVSVAGICVGLWRAGGATRSVAQHSECTIIVADVVAEAKQGS